MSPFLDTYVSKLHSLYPTTRKLQNLAASIENLVCEQEIPLKKTVYHRAEEAIKKIFAYTRTPTYQSQLAQNISPAEREILECDVQNNSVLMCYDFHYDDKTDQLSLIEINTNASAYLLVDTLYGLFAPQPTPLQYLKDAFFKETTWVPHPAQPLHVAIIDDEPQKQKMYVEFCMYQDLFQSWGWQTRIFDFKDPEVLKSHFIYNRHTDFYFTDSTAHALREAFLHKKIIFSPNPREYLLLADKARFVELYSARVSDVILPTQVIHSGTDTGQLWTDRKKLFFKPKNSFGGKATYRGSSISRRHFDELVTKEFIAQEYRPPGEFNGWKYDLRFYVYQNEIHLACARLYQGQVTNFATPGGGLSRIKFI